MDKLITYVGLDARCVKGAACKAGSRRQRPAVLLRSRALWLRDPAAIGCLRTRLRR